MTIKLSTYSYYRLINYCVKGPERVAVFIEISNKISSKESFFAISFFNSTRVYLERCSYAKFGNVHRSVQINIHEVKLQQNV